MENDSVVDQVWEQTGKAIAIPGKPTELLVPKEWYKDGGGPALVTSIDGQTPAGRKEILSCINGDTEKADGYINTTMYVVHVVMHPVVVENEVTGESINAVRTVLVTAHGERIAFVSVGIAKSLSLISSLISPPPWPKGLKLKLRRVPTKNERSMYRLEPVE
jgi:hypothetical protein